MNKPTPGSFINLPAGYFGMVLGIIGMGFAWRYAAIIWPVPSAVGEALVALAGVIWLLLALAFITRLVRYPHSVVAEIHHPLMSSFVSLFPATTMLVAIGVAPYLRGRRGLTGTKIACAHGACGSCSVLLGKPGANGFDYQPINACI